MKKLTREIVTEEITGYEAIDGTWFKTEEECRKYEESAKIVAYGKVRQYIVGETNCYNLFDGNGYEDNHIDIINIKDAEVLNMLNQYRVLCEKDVKLIKDDCIGKTLMIGWDYDHCWSWNMGTIDDICDKIRKDYEWSLKKDEEDK